MHDNDKTLYQEILISGAGQGLLLLREQVSSQTMVCFRLFSDSGNHGFRMLPQRQENEL